MRVPSELGRKEFVLVSLVEGEDGMIAFPSPKGSGSVTAFSQADGFIEIDALASSSTPGPRRDVTLIGESARAPDLVIMGSHDVALDVVVGALAERGFTARTIAVGSLGGVAAAQRGECDLAPVHLIDPKSGSYNTHLLDARPVAGEGLAAHAGISVSPGRRALRGQERGRGDGGRARRSLPA